MIDLRKAAEMVLEYLTYGPVAHYTERQELIAALQEALAKDTDLINRIEAYLDDKLSPSTTDKWKEKERIYVDKLNEQLHEIQACQESAVVDVNHFRKALAECQAREAKLREALEMITTARIEPASYYSQCDNGYSPEWLAEQALAMPFDDSALQEALKQAKKDALLEAAKWWDKASTITDINNRASTKEMYSTAAKELRRMAEGQK